MINTAIFDFDGTLGDTLGLCIESFRRAVRELSGRTLSDADIERNFGPDDLGVIQRLLPDHPDLHEQGRQLFLRHYADLHATLAPAPFPGTVELLRSLQEQGIKLAMVTGKRIESAEISLRFFHLNEFFPILETGAPHGGIKPECIHRALERLNATREDAIYIGDTLYDIDACRTVPIRILSAGWAPGTDVATLQARQPDYLLTRFEDLEAFFKEHSGENGN